MLMIAATPKALDTPEQGDRLGTPDWASSAARPDMIAISRAVPAAPATCCSVARMALPWE